MGCNSCLIEDLQYEIKMNNDHNQSALLGIIKCLNSRKIEVTVKENILCITESGVKELLGLSMDGLNQQLISFRLHTQEWKPISEIEKMLEMQWVDEVIKKKLITCHFQPIVNVSGEIFAYEILSRFVKEDGTLIYPSDIFLAAKNRGRLYALDRLCRMTAVKYASCLKNKKAFINFIPTSIYSPEFCLQSTTRLANHLGMDPSQIVFEVVETEKVVDIAHLKKILAFYKEKGFEYALDDVGEGFSTIELLEDLKPHYMKLDMQYVRGVDSDLKKQQIAKQFLHKATETGSIPLAEGVEEIEEFEWLKQAGYQLFQGYLFGKPSPHAMDE
ncbi:EAL domain-containing protein [Lederbergia citrea]|uniref:EAL domain-containing protein n=1 Tax=Lederbergia citrea TaxID=2833581 RepID=A0A942Z6B1_9BACI|nr:EAL domain-containing protein [Lederbergia citrea]MBS4223831.1 EAL domain-containing protein [Lederbergia citrea]